MYAFWQNKNFYTFIILAQSRGKKAISSNKPQHFILSKKLILFP